MNDVWLAHHGIMGQKWGQRRFQNPDGTLTEEGKKRYKHEYSKAAQKINDEVLSTSTGKNRKRRIESEYQKRIEGEDFHNQVHELDDRYSKKYGSDPTNQWSKDTARAYVGELYGLHEKLLKELTYEETKKDIKNSKGYKEVQKLMTEYGDQEFKELAEYEMEKFYEQLAQYEVDNVRIQRG